MHACHCSADDAVASHCHTDDAVAGRRMTGVWEEDARRLRVLDEGLGRARARAGAAAVCRAGCFGCCLGPFPITMHDAERLRLGLARLSAGDPERAARLHSRAAEAMEAMRAAFPGDWTTGVVDDERAGELYAGRYEMIPCPALDLERGQCELYDHRPVACRTFGLAVRMGGVALDPCGLNYRGMSATEVEALRVDLDALDGDDAGLPAGQTVVAAALCR